MRIHVLSDLHLEAAPFTPPETGADLVVLAGDIHNGTAGIDWARAQFRVPVVYLAGNHEAYDGEIAATYAALNAAGDAQVRVLDRGEVIVGGVRLLGCTLWTDFELPTPFPRERALEITQRLVTDFRAIRSGERLFSIEDSLALHRRDRAWLEAALAAPFDGPTVVITHHAPHPGSIAAQFSNHPANPAFVSDLDALMGRAALWIHGHTHTAFDYTVRGTRIVCNPRGYPGERTGFRADFCAAV